MGVGRLQPEKSEIPIVSIGIGQIISKRIEISASLQHGIRGIYTFYAEGKRSLLDERDIASYKEMELDRNRGSEVRQVEGVREEAGRIQGDEASPKESQSKRMLKKHSFLIAK